jgi:uncharacterized membrane protein YcaP (DUF421 family)
MSADWWELIVRVSLIYVFLAVLLRLSGKREIGQLGPLDLLTILLLSETVSPALTAQDDSVTAGMIASGTLVVLTVLMAAGTYGSRRFERVVDGEPRLLVVRGELLQDAARAERITDNELQAALRKQGLTSLEDVEAAYVETDGQISFIKRS